MAASEGSNSGTRHSRRAILTAALAATASAAALRPASAAAAIVLSRTSGKVGTSVTATMSGYSAGESITLRWFDGSSSRTLKTVSADGSGAATATFTTPSAIRGQHPITAKGSLGASASTSFKVITSVSMSPSSGLPGVMVNVTIKGYAAGVTCYVYWYGSTLTTSDSHILGVGGTNSYGERKITFQAPPDASIGGHRVEIRPSGGSAISVKTFTVLS